MSPEKGEGHKHDRVGKCDCVSSVMTIAHIQKIDRGKTGCYADSPGNQLLCLCMHV